MVTKVTVIDAIVEMLPRPLKVSRSDAASTVEATIAALKEISKMLADQPRPCDAKKACKKIHKAVVSAVEAFDALPKSVMTAINYDAHSHKNRSGFKSLLDRCRKWRETIPSFANMELEHKAFIETLTGYAEAAGRLLAHGDAFDRLFSLQSQCATHAFELISGFSCEPKITGTEGGPFREIASLLFYGATGKRDRDLKRACDAELENRRRNEDSLRSLLGDRYDEIFSTGTARFNFENSRP